MAGYKETMDDIHGMRSVDTRMECPRCLATHGGLSQEDLAAAGIDPGSLQKWTGLAGGQADEAQDAGASSDGDASWVDSPLTQDPGVDRSVDAVIQRTQGL
jgi:hypothetical protein